MKLLLILLFPLFLQAQKTNEPTIVYPLLEQFISEAYNRDIPVYHKIREIDSISLKQLKYNYRGLYNPNTKIVTIHNLIFSDRDREKTFYHEIGHVFGLPHSDDEKNIMYIDYSGYFYNDQNWQKAKDEFFKQLKYTMK